MSIVSSVSTSRLDMLRLVKSDGNPGAPLATESGGDTDVPEGSQSDVKGPGGSMDNHNDEEHYGEAARPGPVSEPNDRADATSESDGSTVDVEGHRKVLDGPWLR